ncbi:MAG: EthD family reductase [Acidimicrobiia bacterium]
MATILVMYHTPADPKAFDDYYFGTHVDIAKKIPQLQRYSVNASPVTPFDGSTSPYHLVATLEFATIEDLGAGISSPEGQAAAGDLAHFAMAGATIYTFDTKDV